MCQNYFVAYQKAKTTPALKLDARKANPSQINVFSSRRWDTKM